MPLHRLKTRKPQAWVMETQIHSTDVPKKELFPHVLTSTYGASATALGPSPYCLLFVQTKGLQSLFFIKD